MKYLLMILDFLAASGLTIAGLSAGGIVPPKYGAIAGGVGTVAGKLAASPSFMQKPPKTE